MLGPPPPPPPLLNPNPSTHPPCLQIDFVLYDVCQLLHSPAHGLKADTVIMNPPFGTKRKGVDMVCAMPGHDTVVIIRNQTAVFCNPVIQSAVMFSLLDAPVAPGHLMDMKDMEVSVRPSATCPNKTEKHLACKI